MLAYPLDEAQTMLTDKLRAAEASLNNCEDDLEFLREQITVRDIFYYTPTTFPNIREWQKRKK
jgi:Prefoldin subunit